MRLPKCLSALYYKVRRRSRRTRRSWRSWKGRRSSRGGMSQGDGWKLEVQHTELVLHVLTVTTQLLCLKTDRNGFFLAAFYTLTRTRPTYFFTPYKNKKQTQKHRISQKRLRATHEMPRGVAEID